MATRFPIRCLECGALLGDKRVDYLEKVQKMESGITGDPLYYMFITDGEYMVADILDELDIKNICCRTLMLTNVTMDDLNRLIKK